MESRPSIATISDHRAITTGDPKVWASFTNARNAAEFCRSWLALQCGMIQGAVAALLLLEEQDRRYATAAVWPDPHRDVTDLAPAAQQALDERRGVVRPIEASADQPAARGGGSQVAFPVDVGNRLYGVVVVHVASRNPQELQNILHQLVWGVGWLESLFRRHQNEKDVALIERTTFAMDILAGASEHKAFRTSAYEVANELASRLGCRRVSVGLHRDGAVTLEAISHSAVVDEKTHTVSTLLNAMEEALDQGGTIVHPAYPNAAQRIDLAHRDLARLSGATSVASVLMASAGRPVGVITLERDSAEAFDARTVQVLEAVAVLLGPLLEMKAETQRFLAGRAVDKTKDGLRALFGPRRPALKLMTLAVVLVVAGLALIDGPFRVSAKAVVEGSVQRAAVAPFDGFVATAPARAGDVVEAGQILATLDDRDLVLERVRWKSEVEQQTVKYNDALGKHDRPATRVAQALIDQAQAQLALAEDKLGRSRIRAPFRGVVVSGDLSQVLGSPIERGKTMFELAPLDTFRVILEVDERDIGHVAVGQTGRLVLTGLADRATGMTVKAVTPVATAAEGRNFFRVEADLLDEGVKPRPGMEGIGKIDIEDRRLLWIWTRSLLDWVRLTLWKLWP